MPGMTLYAALRALLYMIGSFACHLESYVLWSDGFTRVCCVVSCHRLIVCCGVLVMIIMIVTVTIVKYRDSCVLRVVTVKKKYSIKKVHCMYVRYVT